MAGRSRKSSGRGTAVSLGILAAATIGSWWVFLRGDGVRDSRNSRTLTAMASLPADLPESASGGITSPSVPAPLPQEASEPARPPEPPSSRIPALIEASAEARQRNDLLSARTSLGHALALAPAEPQRGKVRAEVAELAEETILSPRIYEGDPLAARYVLQPGDTLAKVAAENKVTAELLAALNRIADKNLVRAGQVIKLVKGPFHAVVDKKAYVLDVYLGDCFVRSFRVGLGADDSTPNGTWRVSSKLVNPTYYPPRGGTIIAADDPANPLGERWIGLTGIDGAALGQERYGIHGTIEPESIGQSSSMGCIRLQNPDVELLYTYLVEKHSTVTVE